jgi:hypothetical protein
MRGRATSAPGILVVGSGQVASVMALTMAKLGRNVVMAVRDPAIRTHLTSSRTFEFGRLRVPIPDHVRVVDETNVELIGECLLRTAAVACCVPPAAASDALRTVGEASKQLPSLVPPDMPVELFAQAQKFDIDHLPSLNPGISMARSMPVMLFGRGAPAVREVSRDYPHLESVFSAMALSHVTDWAQTVAAAPCVTPSETVVPPNAGENERERSVREPSPIFRSTHNQLGAFPSLYIGAKATASLRSRDAIKNAVRPLETSWAPEIFNTESNISVISDAAEFVEFVGALAVAAAYGGGLINGRYGFSSHMTAGFLRNLVDAGNAVLEKRKCRRLDSTAISILHVSVSDTASREYIFGRQQVELFSPKSTAERVFVGGQESVQWKSLHRTLQYLAELEGPFFEGLRSTLDGFYRPSSVAETLGMVKVDWERRGSYADKLLEATRILDEHVIQGKDASETHQRVSEVLGAQKQARSAPAAPPSARASVFELSHEEG